MILVIKSSLYSQYWSFQDYCRKSSVSQHKIGTLHNIQFLMMKIEILLKGGNSIKDRGVPVLLLHWHESPQGT
jgi:hypothetical protein